MTQETAPTSYGAVSKVLHWLIFLLLTLQYIIGETMPHISGNTPFEGRVAWHVYVGVAILFAIVIRLAWRVLYLVPVLPTEPAWQRWLAEAIHWTLYAVIAVITMLGWAAASFRGWDVSLFGYLTLPALAEKGTRWAHTAGDVHIVLVYVLLGIIALHVLSALYHYFVKHDRVLQRMLP